MLARNRRLSTRALREARWQHEIKTPFFIVRWTSPGRASGRYAVSVPLRVSKSAPVRNRLRRVVFIALRAHAPQYGPHAMFVMLPKALTATPEELELAVKEFTERAATSTP